jgi:hypothetical protein
MNEGTGRPARGALIRASLVAAILVAVLIPRLGAAGTPATGPRSSDGSPCKDDSRWDGLDPLVDDPTGDIRALAVTSDRPGDLGASERVFVKVEVAPGVPIHRLLIDTDGDRSTGMWTAQSHLSDSGWDHMVDPEHGVLYRHAAEHPDEWDWHSVQADGLKVIESADSYLFCIPLAALPAVDTLYLTAENSRNSIPRRFLRGAAYPPGADVVRPVVVKKPKRMAFYYSGSPWIVRECTSFVDTDVACATRVFSRFRHVVFGARLEETSRGGHEGATNLMHLLRERSPKTELWGYISFLGSQKNPDGTRDEIFELNDYVERAKAWRAMGATGIFLDEYDVCDPSWQGWCRTGPDGEGVLLTRTRQVEIVEALHELGLAVFANSHSVQNALGTIDGIPSPLGGGTSKRPPDMYLLENPTVVLGSYHAGVDYEASQARFVQAVRLTQATGARLGVLDSMRGHVPDGAYTWDEYRVGWWQAAMAGAGAYAFHADNLPILRAPVDAVAGRGLRFDQRGIRFAANGSETMRGVVGACGEPLGRFVRVQNEDVPRVGYEADGLGCEATRGLRSGV